MKEVKDMVLGVVEKQRKVDQHPISQLKMLVMLNGLSQN
jgi:hypothetical protein